MKRGFIIAIVILFAAAIITGIVLHLKHRAARPLAPPHSVRTHAGANYVAQVLTVAIRRTGTNHHLIITARLENPNPAAITLHRDWFILVDGTREYFSPETNAAQPARIQLPANAASDREQFTYAITHKSLAGVLSWMDGYQHLVKIKSARYYQSRLADGATVTFNQLDW
jgi:hypothetical protein